MFKNRSFQKVILVLALLALLVGAAFTASAHPSLIAGLPPCSAVFGNCKLGPNSFGALSGQLLAALNIYVGNLSNKSGTAAQGKEMAFVIRFPPTP